MVKQTNQTSGGIGFLGLLTIVFIVLKLVNVISWSWWWVLAPIWLPLAIALIAAGLFFGIGVIQYKIKKRDANMKITLFKSIFPFIDTLEVKTDENNFLEKFKSLQHITKDFHQTLEDWGYAPNLYFFDGMWHVSWISCEEGDSIKDFEGNTSEEAIDKACNWFHSTFCNS